ncbi:MAG: SAM-dependent methyltransferase, partial [Lachnospiraceae bacterium]|nr:SAM-dependent methyltransferase [Lachnospiraceae bacterium]
MDTKLHDLLSEAITPNTFVSLILSHSRKPLEVTKAKLRPILLKGALTIQAERFCGKQVFHSNMSFDEAVTYLEQELTETFQQAEITEKTRTHTILISKKGTVTIKTKQRKPDASGMINAAANAPQSLAHNKTKAYILPEGTPVPYLVELGVMT